MTRTPGITGKSFIGFCPPCSSLSSARCGAGASKGPPTATHGHGSPGCLASTGWGAQGGIRGWMGPPCPPASPRSSRRVQTPEHPQHGAGDRDGVGPGCRVPALHSRVWGACAGGQPGRGQGDTSSGLFTWGGRGQRPPPAWRRGALRSWCVGQRGDMTGKVLGASPWGSQPSQPPGRGVQGVSQCPPTPWGGVGLHWTPPAAGRIPCTPQPQEPPRHNTDTTTRV